LVCNNNLIDSLVWNFSVPENILLDGEIVKMDLDEIKKQSNTEKISLSDLLQAEIDYNRLNEIINKNFTQKIKIQKS
jgi:predicted nucleotidyltransferase